MWKCSSPALLLVRKFTAFATNKCGPWTASLNKVGLATWARSSGCGAHVAEHAARVGEFTLGWAVDRAVLEHMGRSASRWRIAWVPLSELPRVAVLPMVEKRRNGLHCSCGTEPESSLGCVENAARRPGSWNG